MTNIKMIPVKAELIRSKSRTRIPITIKSFEFSEDKNRVMITFEKAISFQSYDTLHIDYIYYPEDILK